MGGPLSRALEEMIQTQELITGSRPFGHWSILSFFLHHASCMNPCDMIAFGPLLS